MSEIKNRDQYFTFHCPFLPPKASWGSFGRSSTHSVRWGTKQVPNLPNFVFFHPAQTSFLLALVGSISDELLENPKSLLPVLACSVSAHLPHISWPLKQSVTSTVWVLLDVKAVWYISALYLCVGSSFKLYIAQLMPPDNEILWMLLCLLCFETVVLHIAFLSLMVCKVLPPSHLMPPARILGIHNDPYQVWVVELLVSNLKHKK